MIKIENKEQRLCSHGCGKIAHYSNLSGKLCCCETFYQCPGYKLKQSIKTKNRSPSIPKGTILKTKIYHPGKCEVCGKDHDGTYGSGRFCCESCARKASSLNCDKKAVNKKISETLKARSKYQIQQSILKGIETRKKRQKILPLIQKLKSTKCRICGQLVCIYPDKCKHMKHLKLDQYKSVIDLTKLGTIEIYHEYEKFARTIYNLYVNQRKSILDIQKILNIKNFTSIYFLLKKFKIEKRSQSESCINSMIMKPDSFKFFVYNQYHCGYHTSWEGKKFWYRSSYELDYAKELDEKKIRYEMESIRLPYYSNYKKRLSLMISDFYLPDTNTIVEIKGDFTYIKEDIKDRFIFLKEKGYNCKLILEHIEYELQNLPETKTKRNIENYWSPESESN